MKTLELFAGCGGLAKGLELSGFKHAALLEFNHCACESLRANFKPSLVHEIDVRKVDFSAFKGVDLVSGGPPCQPFSLGGLAKAYDDQRDMFPQAARAISEARPRGFVFENVKGLLREKFKPYFTYILRSLSYPDCVRGTDEDWREHALRLERISDGGEYDGVRYDVQYKLLNAVDYGVAQIRERVFIVGIRSDVAGDWEWPAPVCPTIGSRIPVSHVLKAVPDPETDKGFADDHVFVPGARTYAGHTGSDIDKPSKTIKAGAHGVPGGENMLRFRDGSVRYMTVHEAKLIQSFPADYKVMGSWGEALRQIGNAVPVSLAASVGRKMFELLREDSKCRKRRSVEEYSGEYPSAGSLEGEQMLLAIERKKAKMDAEQKASGLKGKKYSATAKSGKGKKTAVTGGKKK